MLLPPDDDDDFLKKNSSAATATVNGPRLQALRQQAGLTQEQLAEKAGYSDRLIRKAEASGPLRKATIADLAAALSTPERTVTIADLTLSHQTLALEVLIALLHESPEIGLGAPASSDRTPQAANSVNGFLTNEASPGDLIHPGIQLHVDGSDLGIPFAGRYEGVPGCDEFRKQLNSIGTVTLLMEQTRTFTSPGEVCLQATTEITPPASSSTSSASITVWWFMKVLFEANLIIKVELMYDTGNICRLLGNVAK